MASVMNIGAGNADDAFYRYKMPKLVAKIEGRGNGIKTNVVNCVDIAKALERNPEYVLKYFGCELGAQTNYDKATGTSIVNGAHDSKKLLEVLEGFIKKFVQCYSCGNPETHIKIDKKEILHLKCKACGFLSDIDPRHKLNTFIIKNPPENKLGKEEKKLKKAEEERVRDAEKAAKREKQEKKEKKERKEKKKGSNDGGEGSGEAGEGEEGAHTKTHDTESESEAEGDDGVVWMTDTSAEAAKLRAQEQLTAATSSMVTQGNIEAELEEAKRKTEREERKRLEEEARVQAAAEAAALAVELERLALEQVGVQAVRDLLSGGASPAEVAAKVRTLEAPGGLTGNMRLLYVALLGATPEGAKLSDSIKAHKAVLAALAKDQPSQLAQLIALEHYLAVASPDRAKEAPLALKALYDEDLVEEDIILAWAAKKDAAAILGLTAEATSGVRRAAAPFVEWLQEADEDDDDDE
mmetsp:Transcript_8874/g.15368  ORF Transcript_8874/g.15368 Transcript_8874/m.15368 type:complete len:467 (-) Transcript_8874:612-2012(-)|eukprot:CAMPEP_0119108216 /NCGR_PEP_ID=MMETSP1180-20130426/13530_1 /TAXON_ID=3052 ORGANISM="Chlamydomonas cf sp, Strain CCMP681" /NCGR_SAMPLE_ID=MMETSP1180 /ASSEMBLY_ACC=CAM_ASM_000741 /LENGTH=466 /DNA_ID=CAMNT_0007093807 /DNA_START=249 /DNA_END=1649 /DNA_ORIENTATION=-